MNLRLFFADYSGKDAYIQLAKLTAELLSEREKRKALELLLLDVQRECGTPSVTPMVHSAIERMLRVP